MPIYQYQSESGDIVEVFKSMKSKIPQKIKRKGIQYNRIYSVPSVIIGSKEPKTLGALAEQNTNRMVKEGKIKKKQNKKPWWRTGDKPDMNLASLSKKQRQSYIMTGKTK